MSSFPRARVFRILLVFVTISALFVDGQKSYFDEIKDAMHNLKSFLHTGLDGLAKLAKTIQVVEQFVDATIDEDCEPYTCPKGFIRKANPLHIPESNGCGSFGYTWKEEKLPLKELEECCHTHDYCYDDCGADKDLCDLHFKKCLYKVCSYHEEELSLLFMKACKGTAKLMYTGTLALGCQAYREAQNKACQCYARDEF
ncbi:group XIIA secretory phospholipase A2-like [Daphnia pulicaria]|uniref:group XIIA secretory phospholipase A2-like n=1 Tax=Daphnia pulicaria TaxID=35523 RepID=UPI001EECEEA3|nr:group XIIA secretory phospholipase A2-like [Daphnia pulicaria]XP_046657585.1 group XIIA secretory phospholipase A2-like [Daphnia pulicaria]